MSSRLSNGVVHGEDLPPLISRNTGDDTGDTVQQLCPVPSDGDAGSSAAAEAGSLEDMLAPTAGQLRDRRGGPGAVQRSVAEVRQWFERWLAQVEGRRGRHARVRRGSPYSSSSRLQQQVECPLQPPPTRSDSCDCGVAAQEGDAEFLPTVSALALLYSQMYPESVETDDPPLPTVSALALLHAALYGTPKDAEAGRDGDADPGSSSSLPTVSTLALLHAAALAADVSDEDFTSALTALAVSRSLESVFRSSTLDHLPCPPATCPDDVAPEPMRTYRTYRRALAALQAARRAQRRSGARAVATVHRDDRAPTFIAPQGWFGEPQVCSHDDRSYTVLAPHWLAQWPYDEEEDEADDDDEDSDGWLGWVGELVDAAAGCIQTIVLYELSLLLIDATGLRARFQDWLFGDSDFSVQ